MYTSEIELLKRWQRGEEQAVQAIFMRYYPKALHIAELSGLSIEEAQDCAQEAFLHAFRKREQLRVLETFSRWFYRIVTRCLLDTIGHQKHQKEISLEANETEESLWLEDPAFSPDEVVFSKERHELLWKQVQALPTRYRIPLVLRYYGDLSVKEIAVSLGKREGYVRVLLHRALQRLRALVAAELSQSSLFSEVQQRH